MADGVLWQLAAQAGQNAFANGPDAYAEGLKWRQQQDTDKARKTVLQQLTSGQDPFDPKTGGVGQLIRSGDIAGASALASIAQHLQNGNKFYGTPIYGKRADGTDGLGTFDTHGNFKTIETPGFTVTPGIKTIDTPQGVYVVGSKSGTPVPGASQTQPGQPTQGQPGPANADGVQQPGYYPKDNQKAAQDKAVGHELGERQANLGKAKSSLDSGIASLNQLQSAANEVLNHSGLSHITGLYGVLPNIPGGSGADAQAKLDTLKAKIGFSALQTMRDMSKTGGALGNVSDFENRNLQNSMVALHNAQSEKQIKAALSDLITQVDGMKDRLQGAYDTDYKSIPRPNYGQPQGGQPQGGGQPQAQGGASVPTVAHINALRQNPAMRQQFDAKFGPGSAAQVLGQ